jgi:hypothetical protein
MHKAPSKGGRVIVRCPKDANAAFEQEGMHAALEVNGPRFAHAILTTEELLALVPC